MDTQKVAKVAQLVSSQLNPQEVQALCQMLESNGQDQSAQGGQPAQSPMGMIG